MNAKALVKLMWGQFYYNSQSKQVTKTPANASSKEMFVQFVMDPLVGTYKRVFTDEVMQNTNLIREAHSKIKTKLSKQMPMEDGVLKMVVECLPPPCQAQKTRYRIFCPLLDELDSEEGVQEVKDAIVSCSQGKQ